jgi:hypothetical protein
MTILGKGVGIFPNREVQVRLVDAASGDDITSRPKGVREVPQALNRGPVTKINNGNITNPQKGDKRRPQRVVEPKRR